MDTKFTFLERVKALFGAPGDDEHRRQQAASPNGVHAPKDERDADKRKHVGVLVGRTMLSSREEATIGTVESNQSLSKIRESDEDEAHTPSNLR